MIAPVNAYQSVLTLLAIPQYVPLLIPQPFNTRRSLAHAVVASVLKNETVIETPEDVNGVLDLCHVLIKDQKDPRANPAPPSSAGPDRRPSYVASLPATLDEMAEEQGWVARMIHLFRSDDLDTHYEVFCYCGCSQLTSYSAV
jgi:vacuolar protein sorting-associated protein 35